MQTILRKTVTWLAVIMLITGFALPHVCLDDNGPTIKAEQQLKSVKVALDDHQGGSKAKDGCCVSHHCCVAKLVNLGQSVSKAAFYSKAGLMAPSSVHFSSFDPKGLDRPPKYFA